MNQTKIEWCDKTWNPITGCTPISPGCQNCYAKKMAETRLRGRGGYPSDKPFQPGTFHPHRLKDPLKLKKPSRIFVSSMGDLFHEDVSNEHLSLVFSEMCGTQWCNGHIFLLLTKRPKWMREVIREIKEDLEEQRKPTINPDGTKTIHCVFAFPLENIWLGVTVCNQQEADEKIPILLSIPAEKHFVGIEPILERIDISQYIGDSNRRPWTHGLDWVITGAETGANARRGCDPNWFRSLRDQCVAAKVPFFLKQMTADHQDRLDGEIWKQIPKRS